MEHTDKKQKQNENEVQSENRLEYIVADKLYEQLKGKTFYKLEAVDKECNVQILYIEIDKIVLAPNLRLFISIDKLSNEEVLDIEVFNEDTCLKLIDLHNECLYTVSNFSILFPEEVKILNQFHSGVVVEKMKPGFLLLKNGGLCLIRSTDYRDYKVRLDNPIILNSINKVFKKIYVCFDPTIKILNGFSIVNIKINPFSFFQYHNDLESLACDIESNLSKNDVWLIKKEKIYSNINKYVGYGFYFLIVITFLLNLLVTKSVFTIDWILIIPSLFYIFLIIFFHKMKKSDTELISLKRKDDLKRKIRSAKLIGTTLGFVFLISILIAVTLSYKYSSDYVYDKQKKTFLDNNSFVVNKKYFLNSDAVLKRFIPVYSKYSFDILVDDTNELPSFSKRYIDLKVNISFYQDKILLDKNLKSKLSNTIEIFARNINKGLYGDLYNLNKYEYKKTLIDIEEDINNVLELTLKKKGHSVIISDVIINTGYAKLDRAD